ncbi:MAG TPA: CHAT domain-containing protein [Myxococcaceae bacterium]|nr:CHAT domain-containing protein [Myxococcaceae bacterium]
MVRAQPRALASYRCYWDLAHGGRRIEAERALEVILRRQPENPGALLYLGLCRDERGLESRELFRRSISAFQRSGDPEGEGYARLALFAVECMEGRSCEENRDQLDQADALAARFHLADLRALAIVWRARDALMADDLGAAERHLRRAEVAVGPAGPLWLRSWILAQFGFLFLEEGRFAEALDTFRTQANLVEAVSPAVHAIALGGMGTAALELAQRGELDRGEAERMLRNALDAEDRVGVDLGSRYAGSLVTRLQLAFLHGPTDAAIDELQRLRRTHEQRGSNYPFPVLWLLARFTFEHDRSALPGALRYADEAVALCQLRSHEWERAYGLLARADLLWRGGDRGRGVADARAALDSFERLRGRQPEATVRARYGASTAFAHQLVAGWLLDPARGPPDAEAAFEIMERLRARVLFENLLAAHGRRELPPHLREGGVDIHQRISMLQRRLLDSGLGEQRTEVQRALDAAEAEEAAWNDDVARALPEFRSLEFAPPRLVDVQRALVPEEAMLLFQTWTREPNPEAPYEDGSSWVLTVTRESVRAHRIPDAERLQPGIEQWLALLARRDGSEAPGAARLYRDLLGPALEGLPRRVTRLVVVPDGPLHALPFDALRVTERGTLLAEQYAVSIAPSATLWKHWRSTEPGTRTGALLALADPELPHRAGVGIAEAWRQTGLTLASLPRARDEARVAAAIGASASRMLVGVEASEHLLKSTDLRTYDVLHLATHAVVDVEAPERSAVVLSPGAESEDGLLQSREISELELEGNVVVLAACRSASGLGLRGEGVVGLGRSFFEAGAHAVIGSLWALRDDESSELLDTYYRRLGRGETLADAMAEARRASIRSGAPPAAWAGMVVLGDGALRPLQAVVRGRARQRLEHLAASGALLLALGLGAGVVWRRRRGRA